MYFKEIKREKTVLYIYLHIFHFQCSSFLSENLQFHLGSFTFKLKPSFSFSCTTRLLAVNSLSFHLYEIVYFPQFLKNIFIGYSSMGWQVSSSFQHCEAFHCLLTSIFLMKIKSSNFMSLNWKGQFFRFPTFYRQEVAWQRKLVSYRHGPFLMEKDGWFRSQTQKPRG